MCSKFGQENGVVFLNVDFDTLSQLWMSAHEWVSPGIVLAWGRKEIIAFFC